MIENSRLLKQERLDIRGWLSVSHYYCIPSQKSDISYKTDTNLYLEGLRLATLQQQINITQFKRQRSFNTLQSAQ